MRFRDPQAIRPRIIEGPRRDVFAGPRRDADYLGAYIMTRVGFDLDRAGALWAKLTHLSGKGTTSLLDSHPAGPERLAAWRRTVEELRANPGGMPRRDR